MLLYLTEYLTQFHSGFSVFQYLTLRAILGTLTALAIALFTGPWLIRKLQIKQIGQPIRDDGPQSHFSKAGTPTMGGMLILVAVASGTLLWADLSNHYMWIALLVTLAFGAVGAVDDYRKLKFGNSKGLSAKSKYFWLSLAAFLAAFFLYRTGDPANAAQAEVLIPFMKDVAIPLEFTGGWLSELDAWLGLDGQSALGQWLGFSKGLFTGVLFIVFVYFVINGTSNAVNLTDGLDGLAILPTVMVAAALGIFAYISGHAGFADYLALPHLPGSGELVVFGAAIVGAGLGFLWFNTYPAMIFMGDIGALALGAALGTMAVVVRQELVLVIMGGVFVMETVSVILQVASFKLTGKRIFRMAPIHHHYELKGWPEPRVIVRFWIITVMLVLIGLATIKLR